MTYAKVSIPKGGGNPGTPQPKDPNVIFIATGDIATFPALEEGNVVVTEDITLKEDATAVSCYVTPSTIKVSDTVDGDPDARGFKAKVEMSHPGREDAFENFAERGLNDDYLILLKDADSGQGYRLLGTPSNPMKQNIESQDDQDAVLSKLTFEQAMRSKYKIRRYTGQIPELAPTSVETAPEPPVEESTDPGETV